MTILVAATVTAFVLGIVSLLLAETLPADRLWAPGAALIVGAILGALAIVLTFIWTWALS